MGIPGIGQTSSRGIPGSDPIQNSAIGDSGIEIAKCCPHGDAAAACGIVIRPAASPMAYIFRASVKPPHHFRSG